MPERAARVAVVTLGCGRNEVDSDQVAGSLIAAGFDLVDDPDRADCVLVNTCTFIAPAREESIEVVLDACDRPARAYGTVPVLVIGCMAERYGAELRAALPEVGGVYGFADYPRLPALVTEVLATNPGQYRVAPTGRSSSVLPRGSGGEPRLARGSLARRSLPLLAPTPGPAAPPTAAFPVRTVPRGVWAYLKIASGCDRVCTFCAIPSFRGRFRSRPLAELEAEAHWLAQQGVRELVCVSENTTSWGKDLPDGRHAQVDLVAMLGRVDGIERVRFAYLQPAELTAELLDAMAASPVVAPYYDLSLQHASAEVLARMARSGSAERFLDLVAGIRRRSPGAAFRSSFIVGFPGESEDDLALVEDFLEAAELDWVGVFGFSPEDGTPAATMDGQLPDEEIRARVERIAAIADHVAEGRAERWVGRRLSVLVEGAEAGWAVGRSHREAPETDGEVRFRSDDPPTGRLVPVVVTGAEGVDLVAEPIAG